MARNTIEKLRVYINDASARIKSSHKQYYKEHKFVYVLLFVLSAILFLFFFSLFISLCFFNNALPMFGHLIDTRFQILMAMLFIVFICVLYRYVPAFRNTFDLSERSFTTKLIIAMGALFSLQLVVVINIHTVIGWDVWNLVHYAVYSTQHAPIDSLYINTFQNNLLLFFVLHNYINILNFVGISNYWLWFAILNVILIDIAIIATLVTVREIYPSFRRLTLLFIFLSLLVGLSPWMIVLYSDTILMPFVSLLVLLCLLIVRAKSIGRRIIYASVSGFLFATGWLIKPTIIVIAAALAVIGLIYFLQMRGRINLKQSAAVLLAGSFTLILTISAFNLYVDKQDIIRIDRNMRTPATYTIATGLTLHPTESGRYYYGTYSTDVTGLNYGTTEEKNERLTAFIKERLREFGFADYVAFLFNKARWITSDGYFNWLGEGGGTADFSNPDRNILKALFYPTSRYYPIYMHAANGLWIVVFFGICLAILLQFFSRYSVEKVYGNFNLFLQFIVFFSVFVLLFTEGRSRYLFSFLPVFCMVSVSGYSYIWKLIESSRKPEIQLLKENEV